MLGLCPVCQRYNLCGECATKKYAPPARIKEEPTPKCERRPKKEEEPKK